MNRRSFLGRLVAAAACLALPWRCSPALLAASPAKPKFATVMRYNSGLWFATTHGSVAINDALMPGLAMMPWLGDGWDDVQFEELRRGDLFTTSDSPGKFFVVTSDTFEDPAWPGKENCAVKVKEASPPGGDDVEFACALKDRDKLNLVNSRWTKVGDQWYAPEMLLWTRLDGMRNPRTREWECVGTVTVCPRKEGWNCLVCYSSRDNLIMRVTPLIYDYWPALSDREHCVFLHSLSLGL